MIQTNPQTKHRRFQFWSTDAAKWTSFITTITFGIQKNNSGFQRGANTKFQRKLNAHCRVVETRAEVLMSRQQQTRIFFPLFFPFSLFFLFFSLLFSNLSFFFRFSSMPKFNGGTNFLYSSLDRGQTSFVFSFFLYCFNYTVSYVLDKYFHRKPTVSRIQ